MYFEGDIDEVKIFNRSLTSQEISAIYSSGSGNDEIIVSQETSVDDVWQTCLTPNDGVQNGDEKCSNSVSQSRSKS